MQTVCHVNKMSLFRLNSNISFYIFLTNLTHISLENNQPIYAEDADVHLYLVIYYNIFLYMTTIFNIFSSESV